MSLLFVLLRSSLAREICGVMGKRWPSVEKTYLGKYMERTVYYETLVNWKVWMVNSLVGPIFHQIISVNSQVKQEKKVLELSERTKNNEESTRNDYKKRNLYCFREEETLHVVLQLMCLHVDHMTESTSTFCHH